MPTTFRLASLAARAGSHRAFSTAKSLAAPISRLKLSEAASSEIEESLSNYYGKQFDGCSLKPLLLTEVEKWKTRFTEIIKSTGCGDFLEELAEARRLDSALVIIDGMPSPKIKKEELPTSGELSADLLKKLRPAEVVLGVNCSWLGMKIDGSCNSSGNLIGYVLPTESQRDNPVSYKSATDLKWHNDGWDHEGGAVPYLALLGVVGNKDVQTQILCCEDIVNYFKEHDREHLFAALDCHLDTGDFFNIPTKIINPATNEISYSSKGRFVSEPRIFRGKENLLEALSFLDKALRELPSASLTMMPGDFVKIDNRKAVHRRNVIDGPSSSLEGGKEKTFWNRLLLRGLGEKEK